MRSEGAFCEELGYNLLFRWFLDMNLMERSFDPTVFTKNRRRLLDHRTGHALFDEVVCRLDLGQRRGLVRLEAQADPARGRRRLHCRQGRCRFDPG